MFWIFALALFVVGGTAHAVVYSYNNAQGHYVVSPQKPSDPNIQYAILSDEGEFIRMVPGRNQQIPMTHWRPWFIPKEPHPWDGPSEEHRDLEPVITVEEN